MALINVGTSGGAGGGASTATPKTVAPPRTVVGRVTVTKSTTSHRTVK